MTRPTPLKPNALPARLLSVACAYPLSAGELLARAQEKYGFQQALNSTAKNACTRLIDAGLLRRTGASGRNGAHLYVLTAEGEAALDGLMERAA